MKYQLEDNRIVKPDGKVVANIVDGEIKPTAPVYYKFMDEFQALLELESEVVVESDLADEQPDADEVAVMIEEENAKDEGPGEEPIMINTLGDKTPGYPTWLHKTNPKQAAAQYYGRFVPEYENLIK